MQNCNDIAWFARYESNLHAIGYKVRSSRQHTREQFKRKKRSPNYKKKKKKRAPNTGERNAHDEEERTFRRSL